MIPSPRLEATRFAGLIRRPLVAVALTSALLAGGLTTHSLAAASSVGSAQAHARALAATVSRLQDQAEAASQRYDAAEERLSAAVSTQVSADRQLGAVQNAAAAKQQLIDQQARTLYESGSGSAGVVASLVTGTNPADAMERLQVASSVLDYDSQQASAAELVVSQASALESKDVKASRAVTALQISASSAANQVQQLLASARTQLADANHTVRTLEAQAAAAAAAASAQAFDTAVTAAGGTLNVSGPITAPNQVAATAISWAKNRIGVPYVWGATGPDSFDCSGLTQWSYAHAGIALPRTAAEQWGSGPHPSLSQLEPGDLLFWAFDTSNPATIHHVAMYLGDGLMVAAPHTGVDVQIQPVYLDGFIGATRPWATG